MNEPTSASSNNAPRTGVPSPKAQSWGTIISIIIIVLMIIIGAFYSWGKRVAQESAFPAPPSGQQ